MARSRRMKRSGDASAKARAVQVPPFGRSVSTRLEQPRGEPGQPGERRPGRVAAAQALRRAGVEREPLRDVVAGREQELARVLGAALARARDLADDAPAVVELARERGGEQPERARRARVGLAEARAGASSMPKRRLTTKAVWPKPLFVAVSVRCFTHASLPRRMPQSSLRASLRVSGIASRRTPPPASSCCQPASISSQPGADCAAG